MQARGGNRLRSSVVLLVRSRAAAKKPRTGANRQCVISAIFGTTHLISGDSRLRASPFDHRSCSWNERKKAVDRLVRISKRLATELRSLSIDVLPRPRIRIKHMRERGGKL